MVLSRLCRSTSDQVSLRELPHARGKSKASAPSCGDGARVTLVRASLPARLESSHRCGALNALRGWGTSGEGPSSRQVGDTESWFQHAVGSLACTPTGGQTLPGNPSLSQPALAPISAVTGVLALSGGHPFAAQLCWLKCPTATVPSGAPELHAIPHPNA